VNAKKKRGEKGKSGLRLDTLGLAVSFRSPFCLATLEDERERKTERKRGEGRVLVKPGLVALVAVVSTIYNERSEEGRGESGKGVVNP